MGTFSIRLLTDQGKPWGGREVTVWYPFAGGHESRDTDSGGWATFPTHNHSGTEKIFSRDLLSRGEKIYDGARLTFTVK